MQPIQLRPVRHVVLADTKLSIVSTKHEGATFVAVHTHTILVREHQNLLYCFAIACCGPLSLSHFQSKSSNDDGTSRPDGLVTIHARINECGVGSAPSVMSSWGTSRPCDRTHMSVSSSYGGSAVNKAYATTPQLQLSHTKPYVLPSVERRTSGAT